MSREPFLWRSLKRQFKPGALLDGAYVGCVLNSLWSEPASNAGQTTVVPSEAQRAGDLSAISDSLTDTVKGAAWAQVLSKRLGYPVAAGERYYVPGCTSSATCVFPNARIPTSAFAPPVLPLLKFLPGPNGALEGQPSFSTAAFNNTLRQKNVGNIVVKAPEPAIP